MHNTNNVQDTQTLNTDRKPTPTAPTQPAVPSAHWPQQPSTGLSIKRLSLVLKRAQIPHFRRACVPTGYSSSSRAAAAA